MEDGFLFKPDELAAMFYIALTQHLSRQSTFADSRRGVLVATRSLFRALPPDQIEARATRGRGGLRRGGDQVGAKAKRARRCEPVEAVVVIASEAKQSSLS